MAVNSVLMLIFVLLFPLYNAAGQTPDKEDFHAFFMRFALEKEFQLERTKFPLTKIFLVSDPKPLGDYIEKTVEVDRSEWEHNSFYYRSDRKYRSQIFDNFGAELRDTDERVFAWLGIGGGFQMYYYFSRIDGKWYLVKIKDWSIL